jgi:ubiquinone/menaquinone biosynthesis C-methylase UbiE
MPARYDSLFLVRFCQLPLWHRTAVETLRPVVKSADILDVACGTGSLLAGLARSGFTSLAGVDLAPRMLDVAREKLAAQNAHADLRVADAEDSLPWASESFDIAALTAALHHFYRPHDALREIRRVLRPGGRVLVIDPCFFTPVRQIVNLYLRIGSHDGDFRFYSRKQACRLLADDGFDCRESKRVGLWGFLVIALKGVCVAQDERLIPSADASEA